MKGYQDLICHCAHGAARTHAHMHTTTHILFLISLLICFPLPLSFPILLSLIPSPYLPRNCIPAPTLIFFLPISQPSLQHSAPSTSPTSSTLSSCLAPLSPLLVGQRLHPPCSVVLCLVAVTIHPPHVHTLTRQQHLWQIMDIKAPCINNILINWHRHSFYVVHKNVNVWDMACSLGLSLSADTTLFAFSRLRWFIVLVTIHGEKVITVKITV